MGIDWIKLTVLFFVLTSSPYSGAECPKNWFDCGNGKCIGEIWLCDGDNDCGNANDEIGCENTPLENGCLLSQFRCKSNNHCIPEKWLCDGEKDCIDGSDEFQCDNVTVKCTGFICRNHDCIPNSWRCDGNEDCADGSDEELCLQSKLCTESEFLCSSGSCVNRSLVCNGKKDCVDGSDEGPLCGDPCETATCSQNCRNTPAAHQCYCNEGYKLDTKDNKTCNDIDECQQEGFCSHECTNTVGSYRCTCHDGYELMNRTCRAAGADPLLIFSTTKEVRGIHLRSDQHFLIQRAMAGASAVDVDPKTQRIYWVEISNRSSIYTAKTDGSGFRSVLSHGLLLPEDIAVDYITNSLYVTDSGLRQVLACKEDGTMCHVLHETNVEKPRSIALDPDDRLMYWSDWGAHSSGIHRSGMDGSRRISMVSKNIGWPNGIAIDHASNRLYWADAKLSTIEFITLDGSIRKVLLNSTVFHPYSLAVFEDSIYWSDWRTFSLESCNKFTGHKMTVLARENGRRIMGVHVYHPVLIAKVSNPCLSNDCSHMCLISPVKVFSCACPHGLKLSTDQKTCIETEEHGASIFVSEGSSVFYIRPKSVGSDTLTELPLSLGDAMITRVSYDSKSRFMFVADVRKPAIYAINMTSLHIQELVRNYVTSPEDLDFDWKSNNLYWIDSSKKTVEMINIDLLRRVVILTDLMPPVALAISPARGYMFIATIEYQSVTMYDMDGKNKKVLHSVHGMPISLAVHPSKSILYWTDPRAGTISYANYSSSSAARIMKTGLDGVMSLAASEEYIYWTARGRELNMLNGNLSHVLELPGQDKGSVSRKVTYSPGLITGLSVCLTGNGGCSYVCVTSPRGRTCACSSDMILSDDNATCVAKECDANDFKCVNGRCLPVAQRCDGRKDCTDGSDEVGCGNKCPGDDFLCKNGRCILKQWRCDHRDDCGDNSDEQDCPPATACTKDQVSCMNGECISMIWRCDGEPDCADSSDEVNCNATRCNIENQIRCDNGQCVPVSWVCDGTNDCYDNSDEKNCSKTAKVCSLQEFQCVSDGACIDQVLKCNGKADCDDSSDEKNCSHFHVECKKDMFLCKDGSCLYGYEVCDGHNDCIHNEDESNCTYSICEPGELLCSSKRCILRKWICDGDADCADGSDEENCVEAKTHPPTLSPGSIDCDGFYCYVTGQCLPWSMVCDGHQDCEDLSDEGGLCSKSCASGNGGCSHICKKTPQGSECFCNKGYRLLSDNKTCGDIDECLEPATCSQFCSNTRGSFTCSCAEGYALNDDQRSCKAEGRSAILMYLLSDQIRGIDLTDHTQEIRIMLNGANISRMDYDVARGVFYWTKLHDGSINRYSIHTNSHDVIYRSCSRPVVVKYDWISKNLYYRDGNSSIGVCTKDGKTCKTLIRSNVEHIDSLAISPTSGFMFWSIWASSVRDENSGIIERAVMDGTNRLRIVRDKAISPTSITVDHVLGMIYWADMLRNTLECADFHGLQRRLIVQSDIHHPTAVIAFEDNIYWADRGTDSIKRCHKFVKGKCEEILEENVKILDFLISHKVMQPKRNSTCQIENGGCSHLCLISRIGRTCACSSSMTLDVDGQTCLGTNEDCESGKYRCKDGTCVNNYQVCDGIKDCRENEDELNCNPFECAPNN